MPWLTTEEAAEILGYHDESIRRLLRSKKLQGRKFGHIWLKEPQSVKDFDEPSAEVLGRTHQAIK